MSGEQGTPGWIKSRIGHLTASRMADAMNFLKTGKPSEARTKYAMELVAERMCDYATDHFVTPAMEYGLEMEPHAKAAYEAKTGVILEPMGFITHPTIEWFGASPDGGVDGIGLAEFKVPTPVTYVRWLANGVVPEEHKPQMLAQLACTGRTWCDFVAFNPRAGVGPQLFMRRYEPEAEEIAKVEEMARQFLAEVDQLFDLVTQKEAA